MMLAGGHGRVTLLIARGGAFDLVVRLLPGVCVATDNDLGNGGVMALLAPALASMTQMTSLNLRSACSWLGGQRAVAVA